MGTIIVVILVLLLIGAGPWGPPYGWHGYGWYPSGGLGIVVVILIVLLLLGRI